MSQLTTNDALSRIAISKNVIKEYKTSSSERTVYLDNGTEFQIYIKNPYQNHLGIDIYVNEKSIGNRLVLRPGQSVWLERFMNDDRKFLFETYEVDDTKEMRYAINKNGKVRLDFYHEREEVVYRHEYQPYIVWNNAQSNGDFAINGIGSTITTSCYNCSTTFSDCATASAGIMPLSFNIDKSNANTGTMETGRVEKGSHSDQKFESCDIKFDYSPFSTERLLILPRSRRQNFVEDTRRKYCSQCGKKVRPKDKFCSSCGARLK